MGLVDGLLPESQGHVGLDPELGSKLGAAVAFEHDVPRGRDSDVDQGVEVGTPAQEVQSVERCDKGHRPFALVRALQPEQVTQGEPGLRDGQEREDLLQVDAACFS